jgi:signal transduction histidine kinase
VVNNYLSNAIKYSPPDQPVDVSLQVEDSIARVSVQDRGQGLHPEDQKHVWERFYRAQDVNVEYDLGAGLGLGLYICHTIIEHHHGQVGLHSKQGEGSTFWFTLPLATHKEDQNIDSHA